MRIFDLDGQGARFLGRIVVSTREHGISDENHFLDGNAENIPEFSNTVGFINAMLGDINGGRAAQAYGEFRDKLVQDCLYPFPSAEIRIPFLLFFKGCMLPSPGECNLASPVFNNVSPGSLGLDVRRFGSLFQ